MILRLGGKVRAINYSDPIDFKGTKTNLEQMIGNAVPVNLAEFVAKGILAFRKNGTAEEKSLFPSPEPFTMPNKALHADSFFTTPQNCQ